MVTIGLTGGIGSGKSTVAELWESLGAYVLNADDLAKRLMVENPQVVEQIVDAFGKNSYHRDGSLNRIYLAREAFQKGRVEELNAIVHPYLPAEVKKFRAQAKEDGYPMFVYEAALLLQKSRPDWLDYVVLVQADQEKRLERVMSRDESGREAVLDRMKLQQDFSEAEEQADIIIDNNGTLSELRSKAGQYYQLLTETEPDVIR